ncbi:MAG: sulfur oxidation c-type cytochrome SoxA [Mizugakiibacter sp.]|uniref:sulfur oxidation c-type cytochrome SoxA n=1 Tax=Mizugakiibacter sp. TaxID=1972610 RepID=UPI0031C20B2E|nr:sulfur oxidation c-type cytochrome SoxA [Xanthomonadaceae bacterium]
MKASAKKFGFWLAAAVTAACSFTATLVWAQSAANQDPVAEYRAMFGDDNPAELWLTRGKDLWTAPRGPKHVALANTCDLGMGVGVIAGAYAHLPRYFVDSGRVQDLESRLLTCMVVQQGFKQADLVANRFGDGDRKSDLEALAAYLVDASRGVPISLPLDHPQEKRAYALGEAIFYYRAGTHDFSCATCHSQPDKRIRLQRLPDLATPEGAREAYTTWPAYRVSQGEVRTMEWRLGDCFRQQRLPEMTYGSDAAIALTMFLAKNAEGGELAAPGLKR